MIVSLLASLALAAPPATVLEHRIEAKVDGNARLNRTITWKVRVDDAKACEGGLRAPGIMEAQVEGATVINGYLGCKAATAVGKTFEFTVEERVSGQPFDEVLLASPDLPTERTVIDISAPSWMPLAVWQDDAIVATHESSRGYNSASYIWTHRGPERPTRAAWSIHKDWLGAAGKIEGALKYKISSGRELGELGELDGKSVAEVTQAVYEAMPLGTGVQQYAWDERDLPKARDIVKAMAADDAPEGVSVTERALVLISALRAAGHDAHPALFDPSRLQDAVPLSLVNPSRYTDVAVAVVANGRTVWIDPASPYAPVPETPRSMAGRAAWHMGDHPVRVPAPKLDIGEIVVTGTVQLGSPKNTVKLDISGTGFAVELLRDIFGPMSTGGRKSKLRELMGEARMETLSLSLDHLEDAGPEVRIGVSGEVDSLLEPWANGGLRGTVDTMLAPRLAVLAGERVRVREELVLVPPEGHGFIGTDVSPPALDELALVNRQVLVDEEGIVTVSTVIDRLAPTNTPELEALMAAQVPVGPTIHVLTPATGKDIKTAAKALPGSDRAVATASLYMATGNKKKAIKALSKANKSNVAELLGNYTVESDDALWVELWPMLTSDEQRLAALNEMEHKHLRRTAWQFSGTLTRSPDLTVQRKAYLAILRLQGDRPDPAVDKEAYNAWQKPSRLIKQAYKMAQEAGVQDPELFALIAEEQILSNKLRDARSTLESAEEEGMTNTMAAVLSAELDAMEGAVVEDVVTTVSEAALDEPMNSEIWRHAARAMNRIGRRDLAIEYGARAARLAFDEPYRWLEVIDYALEAGDLATALQAARRASDQHPTHRRSGIRLKITALWAGDMALSNVGAVRGSQGEEFEVPSLDVLVAQAGDEGELAVLRHHDGEVWNNKELLNKRARLLLAANYYDEAARDGLILRRKYYDRDGTGIAFAATAASLWQPNAYKSLDNDVSRSELTRRVRMEWSLISGSRDPKSDAYTLRRQDPKAQLMYDARSKPEDVARMVTGWEAGEDNPDIRLSSPWRKSTALSGPSGITAYSDRLTGESMLFLGPALGLVPGPAGALFPQPERPTKTLLSGANLYKLRDSHMPIWAGVLYRDDGDVVGLGPTRTAAAHAVEEAARIADEALANE